MIELIYNDNFLYVVTHRYYYPTAHQQTFNVRITVELVEDIKWDDITITIYGEKFELIYCKVEEIYSTLGNSFATLNLKLNNHNFKEPYFRCEMFGYYEYYPLSKIPKNVNWIEPL